MPRFDSSSQDSWEFLGEIGFAVVIVGVALEIVDLVVKRKKRNESILVMDAWWLWWVEVASVVLVVLGLAVEFGAGIMATLIARDKSNKLSLQVESAETEAGESKKLAAQIGRTNALLVASNLVLQAEVLRLETTIQNRNITDKNIEDFTAYLKNSHKLPIPVIYLSPDKETYSYALRIREMLDKAGYKCAGTPEGLMFDAGFRIAVNLTGSNSPSVFLGVTISNNAPEYMPSVQNAFNAIGIPAPFEHFQATSYTGNFVVFVTERL